MASVVGAALRQLCIEAVGEEGERFGVLAREVDAGLTGAATADARLDATAAHLLRRLRGRPGDVVVDGDPVAEALLRGR